MCHIKEWQNSSTKNLTSSTFLNRMREKFISPYSPLKCMDYKVYPVLCWTMYLLNEWMNEWMSLLEEWRVFFWCKFMQDTSYSD